MRYGETMSRLGFATGGSRGTPRQLKASLEKCPLAAASSVWIPRRQETPVDRQRSKIWQDRGRLHGLPRLRDARRGQGYGAPKSSQITVTTRSIPAAIPWEA
jgi:hypothetical protein